MIIDHSDDRLYQIIGCEMWLLLIPTLSLLLSDAAEIPSIVEIGLDQARSDYGDANIFWYFLPQGTTKVFQRQFAQ